MLRGRAETGFFGKTRFLNLRFIRIIAEKNKLCKFSVAFATFSKKLCQTGENNKSRRKAL